MIRGEVPFSKGGCRIPVMAENLRDCCRFGREQPGTTVVGLRAIQNGTDTRSMWVSSGQK
jgi:hypothetical protein